MEHLFEKISEGVDRSTSLRAIHHRVDRSVFLRSSWFDTWSVAAEKEASIGLLEWLKRLLFDRQAWNVYRTTRKILENKEAVRSFLNDRIISSVSNSNADFFDTVEENPLTKRQREACASDEDERVRVAAITKFGRHLYGLTQYIGHASLPTRTRGFPTRKRGW